MSESALRLMVAENNVLQKKLAAAEAEIESLAGHIENFRKHNVELAGELTLERQITAMLREALEKIEDYKTQTIFGYSGDEQLAIDDAWSRTADVAEKALAKEQDMRK